MRKASRLNFLLQINSILVLDSDSDRMLFRSFLDTSTAIQSYQGEGREGDRKQDARMHA